jgi:hypothetical protein
MEDERLVVFDYGCTQIVSERRVNGLKKLFLNQDVVNAFKEFGVRLEATWFKGQEQKLRDALFEPFFQKSVGPGWSYSQDLEAKFGDKIKLLREFTDPWVLLMMRSLFSLIRIHQERRISIPFREILPLYLRIHNDPSQELQVHIEISQGGKQSFYLNLPSSSLDNLTHHIPAAVKTKILEEGVSIEKRIQEIKGQGLKAQEVFSIILEDKHYRVWLE